MMPTSIGPQGAGTSAARACGSARQGGAPSADDVRDFESLMTGREPSVRSQDHESPADDERRGRLVAMDVPDVDTAHDLVGGHGNATTGAPPRPRPETAEFGWAFPTVPLVAATSIPAPVAAPRTDADTLAALIERHVAQLSVSPPGADAPQVQLKLDAALLPGAVLTLVKTDGGWALRTAGSSADARRSLASHASALRARFASRALGTLDIEGLEDDEEDRS